MPAHPYLVTLQSIALTHRGTLDSTSDVTLLRLSCRYPTPGVAAVETLKVIPRDSALPTDAELAGDLDQRILFKQVFHGPCVLTVEAVTVDNPSRFGAFLGKVLSTFAGGALGLATQGLASAYVGKATEALGGHLLGDLRAAGGQSREQDLGRATIELALPYPPTEQSLAVDLVLTKDLTRRAEGNPGRGQPHAPEIVILPTGARNGQVRLLFTPLT